MNGIVSKAGNRDGPGRTEITPASPVAPGDGSRILSG